MSSIHPLRHAPRRLDRDRQAAPQVFERLRDAITQLRLLPGASLSRAELAAEFGVSATPVRDALMRLEEEGLVDVFPQHATAVSRIDVKLAQQAHFLRLSLELEIVRKLAIDSNDDLNVALKRLLDEQKRALADGEIETFAALDHAFHRKLYDTAKMGDLWVLVKSRSGHIDRLRALHLPTPGKAQSILKHHALISDAIARQKPELAQDHLRKHLSGTLEYVPKIRAAYPDYIQD